jgi:carbamoyltransferase
LSAVNHVDDTGRLQSVSREENPLYYELIRAFEQKTGLPVLLNTSFNENEPIVCQPEEAIDCFKRTRLDALAIGPYVITKTEKP